MRPMPSLVRGAGLGYSPVLHKCANPDCSQPFKYFRHGKLFSFEMRDSGKVQENEESAMALRKMCPANDIEVRERERAGCCSAGTSSPGVAIKTAPPAEISQTGNRISAT